MGVNGDCIPALGVSVAVRVAACVVLVRATVPGRVARDVDTGGGAGIGVAGTAHATNRMHVTNRAGSKTCAEEMRERLGRTHHASRSKKPFCIAEVKVGATAALYSECDRHAKNRPDDCPLFHRLIVRVFARALSLSCKNRDSKHPIANTGLSHESENALG